MTLVVIGHFEDRGARSLLTINTMAILQSDYDTLWLRFHLIGKYVEFFAFRNLKFSSFWQLDFVAAYLSLDQQRFRSYEISLHQLLMKNANTQDIYLQISMVDNDSFKPRTMKYVIWFWFASILIAHTVVDLLKSCFESKVLSMFDQWKCMKPMNFLQFL